MGDGVWGSRLGTLNIGMGRGQEPQEWISRLVPRGREDVGSELELEMNPDLRLSNAIYIFAPSHGS